MGEVNRKDIIRLLCGVAISFIVLVMLCFGVNELIIFAKKPPQIVYGAPVEMETETETEQLYSDNDLYLLSHLIAGEVNDCDWEMKIAVGSVVLNRVADPRFPSDLYGVIHQPGQYSCTWDGNYNKEPNEDTIEAAKYLLINGSQLPPDVIFQAEFVQGSGIYKSLLAPNGVTEYFCVG